MSIVYYLPSGQITRLTTGMPPAPEGEELFFEYDGQANLALSYVDGGAVVPMPPKPTGAYDFDYSAKQWVQNVDAAWEAVRAQRNRLLQESDWTQLPDVPIATKDARAEYRQALRDVTEQADPFNIVWPQPPG